MRKKYWKYVAFIGSVLILSGAVCVGVLAATGLFQSVSNTFHPAEIEIAVIEDGNTTETETFEKTLEWTLSGDSYTANKKVTVKNRSPSEDGNYADAYLRVTLIPRWSQTLSIQGTSVETDVTNVMELKDFGTLKEITISENKFQMGDVVFYLNADWSESWFFNEQDGYFYYRYIVPPGEETKPLLDHVEIAKDAFDKIDDGVQLKIDVLADGIQTVGGAVEYRWSSVEPTTTEISNKTVNCLKEKATTTTTTATTTTETGGNEDG